MNVKPCPFCGEDAVIEYGAHGSRSFPMCSNKLCPAGKGGTFDFERWNMRPIEDGLRAENDRLRAKNHKLHAALRLYANRLNWHYERLGSERVHPNEVNLYSWEGIEHQQPWQIALAALKDGDV